MKIKSEGIKLFMGELELRGLYEIPDLGGEAEAIEVTTLSDPAHMYIDGILNYGDSLAFKFYYDDADTTQFKKLTSTKTESEWKVQLPDNSTCTFSGTCSAKLDGVGVNAALTYTLSIKPTSAMEWELTGVTQ